MIRFVLWHIMQTSVNCYFLLIFIADAENPVIVGSLEWEYTILIFVPQPTQKFFCFFFVFVFYVFFFFFFCFSKKKKKEIRK